jgi:hypothetical protein
MDDDTPRRKLIKTNQQKENDILNKDIHPPINPEEDDQEYSSLTQQVPKQSTSDDDLAEKVEQCFRNEQTTDIDMMEIDESNKKSSTRRRSRFRFSFSNNHNSSVEEDEQAKSRLNRTHSASIINHDNQIHSSRRRKSYSTIGLANEQTTNIDKKSTKTKSSLANRVKRAFFPSKS